MSVSRILDKKGFTVFTVRQDASLKSIIQELASHHIGVVVVTNDSGEIIGMVSERDVIRELAKHDLSVNKTAVEMMTGTVCKCAPEDTEGEIMERMGKAGVRHLPVEHNGKLVGLVSARDILNLRIEKLDALMKEIRGEAARQA